MEYKIFCPYCGNEGFTEIEGISDFVFCHSCQLFFEVKVFNNETVLINDLPFSVRENSNRVLWEIRHEWRNLCGEYGGNVDDWQLPKFHKEYGKVLSSRIAR